MSPVARRRSRSTEIREQLSHPVVDADGHYIESAPVFKHFLRDYVKEIAGGDLAKRFEQAGGMDYDEMVLRPWGALSWDERRAAWHTRPPWWTHPTRNTLDRATAHAERALEHERASPFAVGGRCLLTSDLVHRLRDRLE